MTNDSFITSLLAEKAKLFEQVNAIDKLLSFGDSHTVKVDNINRQ